MQRLLIIADGMADEPGSGLSSLAEASTPAIDRLAEVGITGSISTAMPDGSAPGSDYAILKILGCNPPPGHARGPLEAMGAGISLEPGEYAWRCNFYCAGEFESFPPPLPPGLSAAELGTLCRELTAAQPGVRFSPIDNAHAVAIMPAEVDVNEIETDICRWLQLSELNRRRWKLGVPQIVGAELWGGGEKPEYSSPYAGQRAMVVCAVPLVRGIAAVLGMECVTPEGATGDLSTDYAAKWTAARKALDAGYEFVMIHVEAPDTASHLGDRAAKIHAIEQIDRHIVAPALKLLQHSPGTQLQHSTKSPLQHSPGIEITLMPDHATSLITRSHTADPIPYFTANSQMFNL